MKIKIVAITESVVILELPDGKQLSVRPGEAISIDNVPAIWEFSNEAQPGNPVTGIEMLTQGGVTLRWAFDPPIQQSRFMTGIGHLSRQFGLEKMPELVLPEPATPPCGAPLTETKEV